MKKLKGYLSTNKNLLEPGCTVAWNGKTYNVITHDYRTVSLLDVARALSRINRYVGNTDLPYSVAQHCVVGASSFLLQGEIDKAFQFFWHDAPEIITNDLSAPFKRSIGDTIEPIEDEITKAFSKKFGFGYPFHPDVKIMDKNLAQYELTFYLDVTNKNIVDSEEYWSADRAMDGYLRTLMKLIIAEKIENNNNGCYKENRTFNTYGTTKKAMLFESISNPNFIFLINGAKWVDNLYFTINGENYTFDKIEYHIMDDGLFIPIQNDNPFLLNGDSIPTLNHVTFDKL